MWEVGLFFFCTDSQVDYEKVKLFTYYVNIIQVTKVTSTQVHSTAVA